MLALKLAFAGLGPMLTHASVGGGLVALCLLGMWISPAFKKDFLFAALFVMNALLFEAVGIHIEKVHRDAQGQVISSTVAQAVAKTQTPKAKASRDKWDNPRY